MKKNLIIVVLAALVVLLFGAYQTACKERDELARANANYYKQIDQAYDYGRMLYGKLVEERDVEKFIPNTMSFCNESKTSCVHVDINGYLWVTEK